MFFVLFLVSALFAVLSVRLFRSAAIAGGAEGWLGLAFLSVGISMPTRAVVSLGVIDDAAMGPLLLLAGHALMALGLSALTLFVHRVFRPEAGWALGVTAALIGLQIATLPTLVFFGAHRTEQSLVTIGVGLVRALPFAWGFVESKRYHRQMQKRAALGLSDPVVTNRFALFAIWNGALFMLPVVLFTLRTWALLGTETGRMLEEGAVARLITGLLALGLGGLGGAAIVALFLSFFPPRFWLARLEERARATA